MKDTLSPSEIEETLRRLGELLEHGGRNAAIVVVGGAALNLLGVVQRNTVDIDVIAVGGGVGPTGTPMIVEPKGLPLDLAEEVARVTRDFNLPPGWINTAVASQWRTGLPPGFADRIHWRQYGGLSVGLAGRWDLIAFKLHATADQDMRSRHLTDLLALQPSREELESAAAWVRTQDAGPEFHVILTRVMAHVAAHTS